MPMRVFAWPYHVSLRKTKLLTPTVRSSPNIAPIDWISSNDREKVTRAAKGLLSIRESSICHYYPALRFLEPLSLKKESNNYDMRSRFYNEKRIMFYQLYAIP